MLDYYYKRLINERLEFVFSLLVTLVSLWTYLFYQTKTLTTLEPSNPNLLVLGTFSYITLILVLICFILIFLYGLYLTEATQHNIEHIKKLAQIYSQILFKWWLYIVFISLITSFVLRLSTLISANIFVTIFLVWAMLLVFTYIYLLILEKIYTGRFDVRDCNRHLSGNIPLGLLLMTIIGLFMYLPLMGFIFSDVEITMDSEFYQRDDVIKLSIESRGFIFSPKITQVEYGGHIVYYNEDPPHHININIDLAELGAVGSKITVKYVPQIIRLPKQKIVTVNVQ